MFERYTEKARRVIFFARYEATVGVGAGQMSRVYSSRIGAIKAEDAGL